VVAATVDGMTSLQRPLCYDCMSEDVAVKVIDLCGFEHWFCAEDWAAEQDLHGKIMTMLEDARQTLDAAMAQDGHHAATTHGDHGQ
jgi:hypothetical protein